MSDSRALHIEVSECEASSCALFRHGISTLLFSLFKSKGGNKRMIAHHLDLT